MKLADTFVSWLPQTPTLDPRPFQADARVDAPAGDAWPCRHCGRLATIKDVARSLDKERTLTFWICEPCGVAGVTPDAIRRAPKNWLEGLEWSEVLEWWKTVGK